jgi:two-component system nitrogen regulation sensor histidine kinase NtrY
MIGKLTPQSFYLEIEKLVSELKTDYMDAVVHYCERNDLELETAALKLAKSERESAWRDLAQQIAHEIKNPLTPIKLSAERLQRKFGQSISDPAFVECTTMIIKQTEDLKNLVNEFSSFARLPQARPVLGSLSKCIEEAMVIFRQSHPQVDLIVENDPTVPDFKFDSDQLKRVLMNLIDNAIAASLSSTNPIKKVTVQTKYDGALKILRLTVSDTGAGIPQNLRTRVFEPYFSTKEGGTGLGLAIVKRIIEDHSGFIRALANDADGGGAKMLIELPVNEVGAWKPS